MYAEVLTETTSEIKLQKLSSWGNQNLCWRMMIRTCAEVKNTLILNRIFIYHQILTSLSHQYSEAISACKILCSEALLFNQDRIICNGFIQTRIFSIWKQHWMSIITLYVGQDFHAYINKLRGQIVYDFCLILQHTSKTLQAYIFIFTLKIV